MMKKGLLLSVLAAGMITASCSKDSVVNSHNSSSADGTISFRTNLDYAKVRGTEETTATINKSGVSFKVWGQQETPKSMIMDGVSVSYANKGGQNVFESSTPVYWPETGKVKFWAVYNDYSGTPSVNGTTNKITGFTPAKAHGTTPMSDMQKDLLMATSEGSKAANADTGVALKFQHALAQVSFQAFNNSSKYDVYIAGVSIHNLDGTADVTFQTSADAKPQWSNNNDGHDSEYHNLGSFPTQKLTGNKVPVTSGTASGSNFMLIPQSIVPYTDVNKNGAFARVYIQVRDKQTGDIIYPEAKAGGGSVTHNNKNVVAPADIELQGVQNWEPGKKYVYILNFSNGIGKRPFTPDPINLNPNPGVNPAPTKPTGPIDVNPTPTPIPVSIAKPIFFKPIVEAFEDGNTNITITM